MSYKLLPMNYVKTKGQKDYVIKAQKKLKV